MDRSQILVQVIETAVCQGWDKPRVCAATTPGKFEPLLLLLASAHCRPPCSSAHWANQYRAIRCGYFQVKKRGKPDRMSWGSKLRCSVYFSAVRYPCPTGPQDEADPQLFTSREQHHLFRALCIIRYSVWIASQVGQRRARRDGFGLPRTDRSAKPFLL